MSCLIITRRTACKATLRKAFKTCGGCLRSFASQARRVRVIRRVFGYFRHGTGDERLSTGIFPTEQSEKCLKAGIELPPAMRIALREVDQLANACSAFRAVRENERRMFDHGRIFLASHAPIHSAPFRWTAQRSIPAIFKAAFKLNGYAAGWRGSALLTRHPSEIPPSSQKQFLNSCGSV